MTKVKICGIRTMEAAKAAINAGADFVGFNFVPSSCRFIEPKAAAKITDFVRTKTKIVGVFQDAKIQLVNGIVSMLGLDFVQLHGKEDLEYMEKVQTRIIKVITVEDEIDVCCVDLFLLDRSKQGTGKMVDPYQARAIADRFPIFLAGGLTPDNVTGVVRLVKPFAVDVAGGVEIDGVQDNKKIKEFIQNAKGAKL